LSLLSVQKRVNNTLLSQREAEICWWCWW